MDKCFGDGVEPVQSVILRANPDEILSFSQDCEDEIAAQAVLIVGVLTIVGKAILLAVVFIQPATKGAQPEHAA